MLPIEVDGGKKGIGEGGKGQGKDMKHSMATYLIATESRKGHRA